MKAVISVLLIAAFVVVVLINIRKYGRMSITAAILLVFGLILGIIGWAMRTGNSIN